MEDASTPARRLGRLILAFTLLVAVLGAAGATTGVSDDRYLLTFPVAGTGSYRDTWGAPRSEGRTHKGADIFADKGTPVVAAADGTIIRMTVGERAGRYIVVEHLDGWLTYYLHLDNDTPGSDDGLGGAPAPGIEVGARVSAGDVLDYVGDSGNAEKTPSHLHFELHRPDGTAINPTPHLDAARINPTPHLDAANSAPGGVSQTAGIEWSPTVQPPDYRASNTELVGHLDPGTGFNAGLAVHDDIAYMGTWGRPEACPGSGVHLIDVSDPAEPTVLSRIATSAVFPGTSTDSVWVGSVDTPHFRGDLAIVAVRLCDTTERSRWSATFRGLAVYDVSRPDAPELLSSFDSGERTQGVNELTAVVRPDGRLVIGATVMQSYLHTEGELGDYRLIDATDPSQLQPLSDWDQRRTMSPESLQQGNAVPTDYHIHSSRFSAAGSVAWLAAWDGGVVMLDLTVLTDPVVAVYLPIEPGTEGNAHSVAVDEASRLLIRTDEDLQPAATGTTPTGWGGQSFYDLSDLDRIEAVGEYRSPNSGGDDSEPSVSGFYSAHEAEIVDGVEYVSAYSDGLRIIDLAEPGSPTEIGSFVPPAAVDMHGYWNAYDGARAFPLVWGVEVVGDLIFFSDVNTGLWVIRRAQPDSSETEDERSSRSTESGLGAS